MSVYKALKNGLVTAFRKPRILVDLWVINAVFALAVAAPMAVLIQKDLGHSLLGRNLRSMDMTWLGDAIFKYQDILPAVRAWIFVLVGLYFVLSIFLNGGVIGRLVDREGPSSLSAFIADCGKYFGRFIRLSLLSLTFDVVTLGLAMNLVATLTRSALENARMEWTGLLIDNLSTLLALLLLTVVRMVFDYARILVVVGDERRVLRALRTALLFLGKRFFRAWFLYLTVSAGFLLGTVVYFAVAGALPPTGLFFLGVAVLWAQVFILFRLWTRMVFFAAQAAYYRMF